MKKEEIISKIKSLNLPSGSYVAFGAAPLAAAGIRETDDIDLLVSKELFEELKAAGWQEFQKAPNDRPIVYDVFEAHHQWDFSDYVPTLEQLLKSATITENIPFGSLQEVRKWKAASGRPKDLADIELIDEYLKKR